MKDLVLCKVEVPNVELEALEDGLTTQAVSPRDQIGGQIGNLDYVSKVGLGRISGYQF